ncbi:lipoyl(octanoyl) transferase LipB [bacterium]|nr:lipoyl(octanoyl) transferase LipB [bacterium]
METIYRRGISWPDLETLQAELKARALADASQAFLLVSEPTPTFTHGISGKPSALLWANPAEKGVAVYPADRGGQWTYHGPGQIVAYPIAHLETLGYARRGVRPYLHALASSVTRFVQNQGIQAEVRDCPFGVYGPSGKLASFGISVRQGIASHGVSVYLKPQGDYFQGIVACGAAEITSSSLEQEGVSLDWDTAAHALSDYIKRGFEGSKK